MRTFATITIHMILLSTNLSNIPALERHSAIRVGDPYRAREQKKDEGFVATNSKQTYKQGKGGNFIRKFETRVLKGKSKKPPNPHSKPKKVKPAKGNKHGNLKSNKEHKKNKEQQKHKIEKIHDTDEDSSESFLRFSVSKSGNSKATSPSHNQINTNRNHNTTDNEKSCDGKDNIDSPNEDCSDGFKKKTTENNKNQQNGEAQDVEKNSNSQRSKSRVSVKDKEAISGNGEETDTFDNQSNAEVPSSSNSSSHWNETLDDDLSSVPCFDNCPPSQIGGNDNATDTNSTGSDGISFRVDTEGTVLDGNSTAQNNTGDVTNSTSENNGTKINLEPQDNLENETENVVTEEDSDAVHNETELDIGGAKNETSNITNGGQADDQFPEGPSPTSDSRVENESKDEIPGPEDGQDEIGSNATSRNRTSEDFFPTDSGNENPSNPQKRKWWPYAVGCAFLLIGAILILCFVRRRTKPKLEPEVLDTDSSDDGLAGTSYILAPDDERRAHARSNRGRKSFGRRQYVAVDEDTSSRAGISRDHGGSSPSTHMTTGSQGLSTLSPTTNLSVLQNDQEGHDAEDTTQNDENHFIAFAQSEANSSISTAPSLNSMHDMPSPDNYDNYVRSKISFEGGSQRNIDELSDIDGDPTITSRSHKMHQHPPET